MKIGNVELGGIVSLAPMAGVTDFAFRRLCRSCGAALTTTEMVSARALVYHDGRSRELLYMPDDEVPAAVQIFGHEPEIMAEAAQIALEISHAAILDINMGCPVGKIVKSGDGCALMKTPELAGRIIEAVCGSVSVPVTVKFRKGWDNGSVNAVEFAGICEQAGASALTVHGRTRAQLYTGRADREIIREVKKAVSIPVTANGDIFSGEDALSERMDAAVRQIEDLALQRSEHAACLEARHQLPWYLHGVPYSGVYRQQLVRVNTLEEIRRIASQVKRDLR